MTTTFRAIALSAAALTLTAALPTAAFAAEAPAKFEVAKTSDVLVKMGIDAFQDGDYDRAIQMNTAAVNGRLSKRKTAVAQTNLCASYAMTGEMKKAEAACAAALELRPGYKPAEANQKLLKIKLAQK